MQRIKDREQEKAIYEAVYEGRKRPQDNREVGQETNKELVVCNYCEIPNHLVIEYRKRMALIKQIQRRKTCNKINKLLKEAKKSPSIESIELIRTAQEVKLNERIE
jgi:hypothetical protein